MINKKNDLVDAFKECFAWVSSDGHIVSVTITDAEYVYVHCAFSKHFGDHGVKVSPSAPYLQEMNGQAERYFGVVVGMAQSVLKTSGVRRSIGILLCSVQRV